MLAHVGGLLPNASRRIKITRRADYGTIDLPNAVKDARRHVSTVEISLDSLTQNVNPAEEITSLITAQRAYEMNSKVISAADEMMQMTARLGGG